ncbi:alpha beta-hydrolase [Armillaria gallica]|uniref:Alpha beta-hydrolase n=1 Tax=Armillaria gallica TaxID=47427 RepID=A0A2H3E2G1_ARMGA|nr:alpha beta-hydrolase [Armillaria gallica]
MSSNASLPSRAPYGTWKSPIDAKLISEAGLSVEDLLVDDITRDLYVLESRPSEGGRNAIVSASDDQDIYGAGWNARSRVHEYGGAPALAHDGQVYFSNIMDGRVYVVNVAKRSTPTAVTPENPSYRYGDFTLHPKDKKWLVSILEDHTVDNATGIKTSLVAINTLTQEFRIIASGADFYSNPRFSPDGRFIVWKEWNFPYMPIQASNLMLASFSIPDVPDAFPSVAAAVLVSGGNGKINGEPTWTPANELIFTTDKDGYLNPWILRGVESDAAPKPEPLSSVTLPEEFGEPSWFLGLSSFAMYDERRVLFSSFRSGRSQLYLANLDTREFLTVETPFVLIQHVRSLGDGKVVFVGKKADDNSGVIEFSWSEEDRKPVYRVLRGDTDLPFPKELISLPEPVELEVLPEGRTTHAILYLPKNPAYAGGIPGELPPAIFNLHGGPNSMLDQALDWTKQYYSSRGWAWIDLNYNGSTGYGRDYMDHLQGQWGVVDVRDSVEALRELGKRGLVDIKRSAIRGRSGGGFTTLQTLSSTTDNFQAGTAWFPATDLIALHVNCHKFQSQYIPGLVGALLEEDSALWKKRSPFYQASQIKAPVLIMQGAIDRIVPPDQTQDMAKTIEANGGLVKYIEFEGEGHGWRKADSIRRSIEEELSFYQERFGLKEAP